MYEVISGRPSGYALRSTRYYWVYIYAKPINRHGMTCSYHALIRFFGDEQSVKLTKRWRLFRLAIKHKFVVFSHNELDRMFCEVDQGQWKPCNTSLFGVLCSCNHWCLYSYYVGRARVLFLFIAWPFKHYCFIRRVRVLLFCMLSQSLFLCSSADFFKFPYADLFIVYLP